MGQLEDIQVFMRVVEAGGISRAAEQLNIAKSAVSRRLSELENRLQTKLIQRTTRRFHLTEKGKEYYQKAQEVMASFEELDNTVLDSQDTFEGRLTISIPLSFGILHMHKAIDAFIEKFPNIKLSVDLSDQEVNMVEQGIDVAFRIGDLDDSSLQARRIFDVELKMLAAPEYLAQFAILNTPADCKAIKFLKYSADSFSNYRLINPQGETELVPIKGDIQSNNGDFLLQLALAGHGVVVLPTFICWQALKEKALVQVLPNYRFETLSAYAVYPQNRYLSRNARAFIDFLIEFYQEGKEWEVQA